MVTKMQHNSDGLGGVFGMILTLILAFVARFTLTDLSAIFAMIAAASTATYYVIKIIHAIKKNKDNEKAS